VGDAETRPVVGTVESAAIVGSTVAVEPTGADPTTAREAGLDAGSSTALSGLQSQPFPPTLQLSSATPELRVRIGDLPVRRIQLGGSVTTLVGAAGALQAGLAAAGPEPELTQARVFWLAGRLLVFPGGEQGALELMPTDRDGTTVRELGLDSDQALPVRGLRSAPLTFPLAFTSAAPEAAVTIGPVGPRTVKFAGAPSIKALAAALEAALAAAPARSAETLALTAELATTARMHPDTVEISAHHGSRLPSGVRGTTSAQRCALASLAMHRLVAGAPAAEVAALAGRALVGGMIRQQGAEYHLVYDAMAAMWGTEEVELTTRVHEEAIADARAKGSLLAFARASSFRAHLRLRHGELLEAEADARAAVEAADPRWPIARIGLSALIEILIERGQLDEADEWLRRGGGDREIPHAFMAGFLLFARGRLRLAQARPADAVADLRTFASRERMWPGRDPGLLPYRGLLALGLRELGERDEALRLAAEGLDRARRWGTGTGIGTSLRALGMIIGGDEGLAHLAEAAEVLEGTPARLEYARALGELGAAQRRAGQRTSARSTLGDALDLASRCRADALAHRFREELVAAGARPRRDRRTGLAALTASELRVSRMAAAGMTNREIAQALFVTLRAVQLHLTHAYRKLGITSRNELGAALGAGERLRG
jgi:DNA-binding CsgD family transcriptional regulator